MSQPEHYDVLILGSGGGGKLTAWHNGRSGRRVAVVERKWIGGSCPNIACLPSKNEIHSAEAAHFARNGAEFGVMTGQVKVDMAKVVQRKRAMVERLVAAHLKNYKESGAELVMGSGRFVAPKTLEVSLNDGGTRTLTGAQVFINVGTHAAIPNVPGLDAARPMTHIEALELDILPAHLIVIGGGYAGLELAQAYRRFGAEVTVVEASPQLMTREDADASHEIRRILTEEGIHIHVPAELLKVSGLSGDEVSIALRTSDGEQTIEGSHILVAAGRIPNTAGIGLDKAGVDLTDRGFVKVNERLETSAPDVWALGECAGSPMFTHISEDDFRIVRDNLSWREPQHGRPAHSLLHVHRSPAGACGIERARSRASGRQDARREATDECGAAGAGDRSNRRLHEGSRRRGGRPHSRLHHGRRRGRRSVGRRADGNDGGPALHAAPRRRLHASDLFRGVELPVLEYAASVQPMTVNPTAKRPLAASNLSRA